MKLRQWRFLRGLTQGQLAERAGLTQQYVSDVEKGRIKHPPYEVLVRLAEVLDIPVAELLPEDLFAVAASPAVTEAVAS